MWITINVEILKEMGIPDHLTCLLRNLYAGQEATVRTEKEYVKAVYCHPAYLTYMQSTSWETRVDDAQAGIKIAGRNINNLSAMTSPYLQKAKN